MTVLDLDGASGARTALLVMHYQPDVFDLAFDGREPAPRSPGALIGACNDLIGRCRQAGIRVVFANFVLPYGDAVLEGRNKILTALAPTGRFRSPECIPDIDARDGDRLYSCPRVSVFSNTSLHPDLRERGIDSLLMAGIASSGVVLSSVAWASDADYEVRIARACCFDPDAEAHEALFRTGFATRGTIV